MSDPASPSFSLSIPARPEYLILCRLAVAGLGRMAQLDEESVEDLKLAVTEACTNAIQHAYPDGDDGSVELTYRAEPDLVSITVQDHGSGHPDDAPRVDDDREGGMGLTIMRAVVDELDFEPAADGQGTRVTLTKRR